MLCQVKSKLSSFAIDISMKYCQKKYELTTYWATRASSDWSAKVQSCARGVGAELTSGYHVVPGSLVPL